MKKVSLIIVVILSVLAAFLGHAEKSHKTETLVLPTTSSTIEDFRIPHTLVPRISRSRPLVVKKTKTVKVVKHYKKRVVVHRHRPTTSLERAFAKVAQCESGGNPRAVNPSGKYRGLYQFSLATWHSLGMSGDPINYSAAAQTRAAIRLYHRSGRGQWPECGRYLP